MSEQQEKKPNIFLRLLAFLVTLALILGALALVVYRDRLNLDAVKRWLSFRKVETGDTGEAAPFTHAGGDKLSVEYLEDGVVMTSGLRRPLLLLLRRTLCRGGGHHGEPGAVRREPGRRGL